MADETKKKPKKIRSAKIQRYFVLGKLAHSFSDSFTGVTVVPGMIGVLVVGKPSTSDILERAVANHHIEEIYADDLPKYKKEGYQEYGEHKGGHAEKMVVGDGAAAEKLKKVQQILGPTPNKVELAKEEDEEDEEDVEDEDEEAEDEETEDEETDEEESLDEKSDNQLKNLIKEHEEITDEERKGYTKFTRAEMLKLLKKYE